MTGRKKQIDVKTIFSTKRGEKADRGETESEKSIRADRTEQTETETEQTKREGKGEQTETEVKI